MCGGGGRYAKYSAYTQYHRHVYVVIGNFEIANCDT